MVDLCVLSGLLVAKVASAGELIQVVFMLVDSGAYDHVCPREFAPMFALTTSSKPRHAMSADGSPIQHSGERRVLAELCGGTRVLITFQVMSVSRPILSVHQLAKRNWIFIVGAQPSQAYVEKNKRRVALVVHEGLYYVPRRLVPQEQICEQVAVTWPVNLTK